MTEMEDRWLSITEICKHLGVSNDTVYKVSAHESTPINSRNNQTILSPAPNAGESHARQSRIRSPGQLLAATD